MSRALASASRHEQDSRRASPRPRDEDVNGQGAHAPDFVQEFGDFLRDGDSPLDERTGIAWGVSIEFEAISRDRGNMVRVVEVELRSDSVVTGSTVRVGERGARVDAKS